MFQSALGVLISEQRLMLMHSQKALYGKERLNLIDLIRLMGTFLSGVGSPPAGS